ncbi:uncharacterized protein EV420DRAFT_1638862 [Desarmillaria tabescens]|uniref:Uncharacterized protein n=1 Tax=Armillaria tabescens TaxID=1929756 RepID=A0AA39NE26_ARMTA|nr:uncharacterized protein EV420DRAFT_1638862 [Desarmillaria tabescens]KAK0463942.1 hypothetical protein EV420DRAFT_1638862 [Desarmillaria tabescens]
MHDSFPPPPYTARNFDRHASQLRTPSYRRSHMLRFHPYRRYGPPLVVDHPLPRQEPSLTIMAAAAMANEAQEKKSEGGGSWKEVVATLIIFAILSRILERVNFL